MSRYPHNWRSISQRIRFERAGGKCEHCGAVHGQPHPITGKRTILAVAHLGTPHRDGTAGNRYDLHDVREENLMALCQRCHFAYDREANAEKRKISKRLKTQEIAKKRFDKNT